jgi:predicted nicotinamide N-methyase
MLAWLARARADVLLGDPGRSYFPKGGVEKLADYQVETSRDLEDRDVRATAVYRLAPPDLPAAGPT